MAWSDYVEAILRGGLPEVIDGRAGNAQGDTRPETTAPSGTLQDRESFARNAAATLGQYGPALVVGGLLLLGVVVLMAARR